MSLLSLSKIFVSSKEGWPELEASHPAVSKLFALLVLPLSLLPPIMLYFSGTQHGDEFLSGFGAKRWELIATLFFVAEMVTFIIMGWLIQVIAKANSVVIDTHDAYMLAGIAPIPLWISSLGLFIPSLIFNAVVSVAALGLSCSIIYHGIYALCHMHEEVVAASITQSVIGVGLIAWASLLVIILPI
jgi:hypothetical protein